VGFVDRRLPLLKVVVSLCWRLQHEVGTDHHFKNMSCIVIPPASDEMTVAPAEFRLHPEN
jgi:hypothetical protein